MTRRPLIVGNWKMNMNVAQATALAQDISYEYDRDFEDVDVVLCPPFTDLRSVRVTLGFDKSPIMLGAQNVYWQPSGAFTGEISAEMLKEIGCNYCIIGHSERREHFGETDETVNLKARALIAQGIAPIICCGENLATRDAKQTIGHITSQVTTALLNISAAELKDVVIAYEPIWAIGTGLAALPEQAEDVCASIRETLADIYGATFASKTRILYGGSMKPSNVAQFAPMPNIDGGLIGTAALVAGDFMSLVKAFL
ncbi:MAG: triose-phosphate isomerase [Coriobacteriales bacterium]|jgi:triosephosphate isomerase|nr:triose-phosphate isomerase [Coriobacteriales bacterium]